MRNHAIRQNPDLMLVELSQFFRRELLRFKELEHRCASVMTREVVRRSGKPRWPRPILHASTWSLGEIGELTEPSREHGPESRVRREAKERITRSELAVLVAAAHDIRPLQCLLL